ncbi:MAG: phosphoadenosine phosphosulfate reductase [Rhodobacteraceae bacterium]|nr:phosphoadenosine phosphosulfate reductase [Paracoccaceae bacterium]
MQDATNSIESSLANLGRREWQARLIAVADENGMHQLLGKRHFATFIDRKDTLLVTFETTQGIRSLSQTAQPFGFEMVRALGWSNMCIMSNGDTWFRDEEVYSFFDQLIDDGFFDDFETVVFYGAGPCGYSAAAFSVVSPGATVVAIQPQATLDPGMSEWDDRFPEMRRTSFRDRFGFAPDMLDAAARAFIIYDPRQELDAMHATLFARPNVTRLKMPGMGGALQTQLMEMNMLYRLLTLAGTSKLTKEAFYDLYRARRDNKFYLNGLRGVLEKEKRYGLLAMLCRNVIRRLDMPKFAERLEELEEMADAGEFRMLEAAQPVPAE